MRMAAISDARDEASARYQGPRISAPGNAFVPVSLMPQALAVPPFLATGTVFAMSLAERGPSPGGAGVVAVQVVAMAPGPPAVLLAGDTRSPARPGRFQ